jgi:aminoglycoside phosphotransferase (APT) family kinase protein
MKKLGTGGKSEVFELPDGRILKLLLREYQELAIDEARNIHILDRAGVPVPRLFDQVEIDGRIGLVFDSPRAGRTLYEDLRARPWRMLKDARLLAELHAGIHKHACPELPSLRDRLKDELETATCLPQTMRHFALELLNGLPEGDSVCHNDLHGGNVIFADGVPVVIDWVRTARGEPLADVALTLTQWSLFRDSRSRALVAIRRGAASVFGRTYLHHYRRLRPHTPERLRAWLIPVAAAYAARRAGDKRSRVEAFVQRQIDQMNSGATLHMPQPNWREASS